MAVEELARAAMARDALAVRSLAQDLLREQPIVSIWAPPESRDPELLVVAAALTELLAMRAGQEPPEWTAGVGSLSRPFYLLRSAETLRRLRKQCEEESPLPLRRRALYAPANFLEFA